MMKRLLLFLFTGLSLPCYAQRISSDSAGILQQALKVAKTDSARMVNDIFLGFYYIEAQRDSAIYYFDKAYQTAKTNNKTYVESMALMAKCYEWTKLNNYPEAFLGLTQALKMAEDSGNYREKEWQIPGRSLAPSNLLSLVHQQMGRLMDATGDTAQAIIQAKVSIRFAEEAGNTYILGLGNKNLGEDYSNSIHLDSVLLLEKEAVVNFKQSWGGYLGEAYRTIGEAYLKMEDPQRALPYFYKAAAADLKYGTMSSLASDYRTLAEYYLAQKQSDSSLVYAKKDLEVLQATGSKEGGRAYEDLYKSYELKHQTDSAYKYQSLALVAKDRTYEATFNSLTNFQRLSLKNMLRLQALEKEKEQTQTSIRLSVLLGGTGVLLLLAIIFYRNSRRKQKANYLLQQQKEELSAQRDELEDKNHELRIETALEQVRSRSLAMHQSAELRDIIQVVFDQLLGLGFEIGNAGFLMDYRQSDDLKVWMADANGVFPSLIHIPYFEHPMNRDYLESRDKGDELFTKVYSFEEKNVWWTEIWKVITGLPEDLSKARLDIRLSSPALAVSRVSLKDTALYLQKFNGISYSEAENATLVRFAKAFEQTYIRFQDLQKSEAQAREAIKQASLDRVRAEIASMRTPGDLQRITPLLWKELTTLGVPFIRSGVFIVDEEAERIHSYLSTPDGKALASFDLPLHAEGIAQTIVPAWRKNQVATRHWSAEEFAANTRALVDSGAVSKTDRMVTEQPDSMLDLHFFPFLQGMLYVGNPSPLNAEEMDQAQSLAAAFSAAYARYEDFNRLEAAKVQVDNTLTELRSTQNQLVQREKMASLGELTAGIAHEIQNPLNFVNNFSEVSVELLQELKEEIVAGHTNDVVSLADDLTQNLEKINYHGKRADSIVKGMLEHSRSRAGEKQLTDLNILAEEFLKLSYHGLRAKDKDFHAEFLTHLTPNLLKANVVQQDMGRVFLNLFNNAFYAVNQKRKTAGKDYRPEVSVSTLSENGRIVIKVKDNGNGIAEAIKDKIMQPFFTTKPTGEGTGLGLSLSYDIVVKGHGGSITVDTREGAFTEFTLTLPSGTKI